MKVGKSRVSSVICIYILDVGKIKVVFVPGLLVTTGWVGLLGCFVFKQVDKNNRMRKKEKVYF